jgi:putative endonuclease
VKDLKIFRSSKDDIKPSHNSVTALTYALPQPSYAIAMDKQYYVYILTNRSNRVMYIGISSNLAARVYQHKQKLILGFTAKYNVNKLVYFEVTSDPYAAVSRERQLKGWVRTRNNKLVEIANPH